MLISTFIALGIIFLIINLIGGKKEVFKQEGELAGIEIQNVALLKDIVEKDSDGDGIKDWEEELWGTDPNNPDTDGDGIPDNIEIEQKRSALAVSASQNGIIEEGSLNETDIFAREFFTTVVALGQSGNFNQGTIDTIANSFSQSITTEDIPDSYSMSDLKITSPAPEGIEGYYNNFKALVENPSYKDIGSELEILAEALQNDDKAVLQELGGIANAYKSLAQEVKNVIVPSDIASTHLAFINNYMKTGEAIQKMEVVFDNPLVGVTGIAQHKTYSDEFVVIVETLETYFEENGII